MGQVSGEGLAGAPEQGRFWLDGVEIRAQLLPASWFWLCWAEGAAKRASRHHNVRGAMSSPAGRFLWTTEIVANAPVCTYDCVQPHQASFLLGLLQQGGSTCCNK